MASQLPDAPAIGMTPEQRDLARHALGLPNKAMRSWRRHYCVGSGRMVSVSVADSGGSPQAAAKSDSEGGH